MKSTRSRRPEDTGWWQKTIKGAIAIIIALIGVRLCKRGYPMFSYIPLIIAGTLIPVVQINELTTVITLVATLVSAFLNAVKLFSQIAAPSLGTRELKYK